MARFAQGVAEVDFGGEEGVRVGLVLFRMGECAAEEVDRVDELEVVVVDDAELVEKKRIGGAQFVCCFEVLARQREVAELEILHAKEELGEVSALEQAGGG